MGKKELAEAEIFVAKEKLLAFKDDYKGERWGNATVNPKNAFAIGIPVESCPSRDYWHYPFRS